mmetsp:Transcript_16541/g.27000  ORF Transcript_16541/g.27000 Transcript_16541/m.27000 type:complete len:93 (+) Transcript_16541:873-1151(+)
MTIIHNTNETDTRQQQQDEIEKTMKYIARQCQKCLACERLIDVTDTNVIKITCPMCKSTWCMLCQQKWSLHGTFTGGLQVCLLVKRKLRVKK